MTGGAMTSGAMTSDALQAAAEKTGVATARDVPEPEASSAMALPGTMKEVGDRVLGVLKAAEDSAKGIFAAVEREAAAVKERADQMMRRAEADLATRRDEGQRLIASAKAQAEAMIAQAKRDLEQQRTDALGEVARLHDAARRIQAHLETAGESLAKSVEILPALIAELSGGVDQRSNNADSADDAVNNVANPGETPEAETPDAETPQAETPQAETPEIQPGEAPQGEAADESAAHDPAPGGDAREPIDVTEPLGD